MTKFETLRSDRLKKKIAIGIIGIFSIGLVVGLSTSQSKYRLVDNIDDVITGTIHVNKSDLNILAIKLKDGEEYADSDTVPTEGYTFNEDESYCETKNTSGEYEADSSLTVEYSNGKVLVDNITKKSRCYLVFDKLLLSASERMLAKLKLIVSEETPNFSKTAQSTCSDTATCETTNGLYETEDDDGKSYYFRGAVTNNYVKFANRCWRIIRINGDGSIRLIYDGEECHANGTSVTANTQDRIVFNSAYVNTNYLDFTYNANSSIKKELDTWYATNLSSYASSIDKNAGFCSDRTVSSTNYNFTNYLAYDRLVTAKTPSLKCTNSNDLYTINSSIKGNKILTIPIGLITADEVVLAGGVWDIANSSYYLYNGQYYWTLSAYNWHRGSSARVFVPTTDGSLTDFNVDARAWMRPVINLFSSVTVSDGNGEQTTPFELS